MKRGVNVRKLPSLFLSLQESVAMMPHPTKPESLYETIRSIVRAVAGGGNLFVGRPAAAGFSRYSKSKRQPVRDHRRWRKHRGVYHGKWCCCGGHEKSGQLAGPFGED